MDWLEKSMGWVLTAITLGVCALLWWGVEESIAARRAFMAECLQDHKQYECTAMWRAGESQVVPVFIPSGR